MEETEGTRGSFTKKDGTPLSYLFWGSFGPQVVAIHGGGHSAETWEIVGSKMSECCRFYALDLRGHGRSFDEMSTHKTDLSIATLVDDCIEFANSIPAEQESKQAIVLLGHSLGGSIVSRAASSGLIKNLEGLIVVDCMEKMAMKGLLHMKTFVSKFPDSFKDPQEAVIWSLKSGVLKNRIAAQKSIPAQLYQTSDGIWKWRCNVKETEGFWEEWFQGMDDCFLSSQCPKILFVSGCDVLLDKDLMVAQMQGKIQVQFVPKSGHVVHQDQPEHVVEVLSRFLFRYKHVDKIPQGVTFSLSPSC